MNYQRHLFQERQVRSVTSNTRADAHDVLEFAGRHHLDVATTEYPLERADQALERSQCGPCLWTMLFQWLGEYTTNQEVVQKYCAARSTPDARQAMWISCWTCVPTWGYFLFLGTGLYVFYKVFPDPQVAEMLSGARKAEEVLPHFVSTQLPAGLSGIVVAAVLAAAMSSMSSAMNSMSAVFVTDVYRRRLVAGRDDGHYVRVAKLSTLVSSAIMIGGAWVLVRSETKTLQHFYVEFTSIIAGGLLGLYLLGLLTTRGDGRAVVSALRSPWVSPPDFVRRPRLAARRLHARTGKPVRQLLHRPGQQPGDVRGRLHVGPPPACAPA